MFLADDKQIHDIWSGYSGKYFDIPHSGFTSYLFHFL